MWHRSVARPVAWAGFAVSLGGVGLIAAGGGGGADLGGDGMVLASVLLSAIFTVGQTRLLRGRDPIAVTAVQFLGAALVTAPFSALTEGVPPAPARTASLLAVVALIAGGTLVPFTLFAFGQSRLPAEIAGAFLNIEPLVGAVAGVVVFGNPAGPAQLGGGAAILGGIALSSVRRPGRRTARPAVRGAGRGGAPCRSAEPVWWRQAAGRASGPAGRPRPARLLGPTRLLDRGCADTAVAGDRAVLGHPVGPGHRECAADASAEPPSAARCRLLPRTAGARRRPRPRPQRHPGRPAPPGPGPRRRPAAPGSGAGAPAGSSGRRGRRDDHAPGLSGRRRARRETGGPRRWPGQLGVA